MDTRTCDPQSFDIQSATIASFPVPPIEPVISIEEPERLKFVHYEPAGTYDILPMYNYKQIENSLKEYLTLTKNPFLGLRWKRFNVKPPTTTLNLEVLKYKEDPPPPPRPMMLFGEPWAKDGSQSYPVPTDPTARGVLKIDDNRGVAAKDEPSSKQNKKPDETDSQLDF